MAPPTTTEDLLDLKMLPAWANEPARANDYADFEGEDADAGQRRSDRPRNRSQDRDRRGPRRGAPRLAPRRRVQPGPMAVSVRFLPHTRAFENVIAQIKSSPVAYS